MSELSLFGDRTAANHSEENRMTTESKMRRLARRHGLVLKKVPSHRHPYPADMFLLIDAGTNCLVVSPGALPGVSLDEVAGYLQG